jgi:hypothetical protein
MNLPNVVLPKFKIKLPLTDKEIFIRPYLAKEEKILLMAQENDNELETLDMLTEVLKNCVLTDGIDIPNLPEADLHYLFLQLRKISKDEIIQIRFTNSPCEMKKAACYSEVDININDIKVPTNNNVSNIIHFDGPEKIGVEMRIPSFKVLRESISLKEQIKSEHDAVIVFLTLTIDNIFTENEVYSVKDISKEQLIEWLENLPTTYIEKIMEFFTRIPRLEHEITYSCNQCGASFTRKLSGLNDFLD